MNHITKTFTIVTLTIIALSCTVTPKVKNIKDTSMILKSPFSGTWEKVKSEDSDSLGNILKDVEKFELSGFGPTEGAKTLEWINLTSSGEGFLLYDSVRVGLGFTYTVSDSLLTLGNTDYRIVEYNENMLKLIRIDGLVSLSDTYDLVTWRRINKSEIKSTRLELLDLIQGEWSSTSLQDVKTTESALFNERAVIIDTIGLKKKSDIYLKFDESRFELGRNSVGVAGVFNYSLADSLIRVDGTPFYSVLKITKDSMSLLGPLLGQQQGDTVRIWKLRRALKN